MIDRIKQRCYFNLVFIIYFSLLLLGERFIRVKIIKIYFLRELKFSLYIYIHDIRCFRLLNKNIHNSLEFLSSTSTSFPPPIFFSVSSPHILFSASPLYSSLYRPTSISNRARSILDELFNSWPIYILNHRRFIKCSKRCSMLQSSDCLLN